MEGRKKYLWLRVAVHVTLVLNLVVLFLISQKFGQTFGFGCKYGILVGAITICGYAVIEHIVLEIFQQRFFHTVGFVSQIRVLCVLYLVYHFYNKVSWSEEFLFVGILICLFMMLGCTRFKVNIFSYGGSDMLGIVCTPKGYFLHRDYWGGKYPTGYYPDECRDEINKSVSKNWEYVGNEETVEDDKVVEED